MPIPSFAGAASLSKQLDVSAHGPPKLRIREKLSKPFMVTLPRIAKSARLNGQRARTFLRGVRWWRELAPGPPARCEELDGDWHPHACRAFFSRGEEVTTLSLAKTTEWIIVRGKQRTFPRVGDRAELAGTESDYGRCRSPQGDARIFPPNCPDGTVAEGYAKIPGEYLVDRVEPMFNVYGLTPDPDAPDYWIIHLR
jgi:hypothetical protein